MVRCDGLLYDLLWGVPLSVLEGYKIWLPWFLIYMRIHEMFNVTDGRDIHLGVVFILLFSHFYLKSLDSPNIFNITDVRHINMFPHQTPGISNQALVFMRDVKMFASRTDISVKSAIYFYNTPAEKWFRPRFCTLKLSEELHFYNLG